MSDKTEKYANFVNLKWNNFIKGVNSGGLYRLIYYAIRSFLVGLQVRRTN